MLSARFLFIGFLALSTFSLSAPAAATTDDTLVATDDLGLGKGSDELDPYAPNVKSMLDAFDAVYEKSTGLSAHIDSPDMAARQLGCTRNACRVWVVVNIAQQQLRLFIDGQETDSWPVSTGLPGHNTPAMDTHPDGRIYDRYTSSKFPEGDYQGLGNMPYAVFVRDGFALHGTPEGNWRKLGRRASHGCIRQHPDKAYYLNRLVRSMGVRNVWVTVY